MPGCSKPLLAGSKSISSATPNEARTEYSSVGFAGVREELDRRRHITLGLERVKRLLSLLGDPHRRLRVAQIVGTNGKGTTAVSLAAALEAVGTPAGAYLSPHVLSYAERVMLRGRYVSEERFAAALGEVIDLADANGVAASQFELLTAGALKLFADGGLCWAVLEAGLGARHDATTAAVPEVVVLTNVGLDHTEYLGETVEEISAEKLASVSTGATLVLGTDDPRVVARARERCEEVGARLIEAASEPGDEGFLAPTVLPPYAARDARLGLRAAEVLLGRELSREERLQSVSAVAGTLPGRFERHEVAGVPVVVDGAHNPSGVAAALEGMREAYGPRPLAVVFGALRDKDVVSMLTALKREASLLVLTRPEGDRGADPAGVEREQGFRDYERRRTLVSEDAVEALELAVREARETGGAVLVTGSLYTVAPVLRWLREG